MPLGDQHADNPTNVRVSMTQGFPNRGSEAKADLPEASPMFMLLFFGSLVSGPAPLPEGGFSGLDPSWLRNHEVKGYGAAGDSQSPAHVEPVGIIRPTPLPSELIIPGFPSGGSPLFGVMGVFTGPNPRTKGESSLMAQLVPHGIVPARASINWALRIARVASEGPDHSGRVLDVLAAGAAPGV